METNVFEHAAREWLRGCSCASPGNPDECEACTRALLEVFKKLAAADPEPEPQPEPAPDPIALHNARRLSG